MPGKLNFSSIYVIFILVDFAAAVVIVVVVVVVVDDDDDKGSVRHCLIRLHYVHYVSLLVDRRVNL